MGNDSRATVRVEGPRFRADAIELRMRERIRETIEQLVEEELTATLGAKRSSRGDLLCGYRRSRRLAE